MDTGTKIIPLKRRHVVRRTVSLSTGPRPDIQAVLDMLHDIDPGLLTRFAPPDTSDAADAGPAPWAPVGQPVAPAPANAIPAVPRPDNAARSRTLTSLVFPEGSSRIMTCALPLFKMTLCLR